jgi:sulfate permease, SulP family
LPAIATSSSYENPLRSSSPRRPVGAALDRLAEHPKVYILDFAAVPMLDSTAAITIAAFAEKAHRTGTQVLICRASVSVRNTLLQHGVQRPLARFTANSQGAVASARENG